MHEVCDFQSTCAFDVIRRRAMKIAVDLWAFKSQTLRVVGRLQSCERLVIDKAHGELFIWKVWKIGQYVLVMIEDHKELVQEVPMNC